MKFVKGDILRGRKKSDAFHPIIFLEGHDDSFFVGAMITHSSNHKDNILMLKEHFKETDNENKKYGLYFDNTHLVEAKLLKRLDWRPFVKVGQLSISGVVFVESKLKGLHPEVWENYIKQT
jgi:hypothetical protein